MECARTRKVCAKLEAAGAAVLPVVAGMRGRSGWPDRYIAWDGAAVWLEFKSEDGRVSPEQRAVIKRLHKNRAHAYVARFVDGTTAINVETLDGDTVTLCQTTQELLTFISQYCRADAQHG